MRARCRRLLGNSRILDYTYLLEVPEEIDYLEPHATLFQEGHGLLGRRSSGTRKDSCDANNQCAGFTYYQGYCWKSFDTCFTIPQT